MAGAVMMVTGCSTPTSVGGTPETSSTSSTDALPPGTPNVAHPLDTTAFQKVPCSVLTGAQLQQLTITATGQPDTTPLGPGCHWDNQTGPSKMDLTVYIVTAGQGLSGPYSQKDTYQVFEPQQDIGGYPALIAMTDDARPQGDCQIAIGASNKQEITVEGQLKTGVDKAPDMANPCPRVRAAAEAVIATIKAGQ
jgi:Protein of unknown function (DUF3558)